MSAVSATDLFVHAGDRPSRLLAVAFALSLLAHLVAVVFLPGFRKLDTTPPKPLEVAIVHPAKPEPMKAERPQPPPKPREIEKAKPRSAREVTPRPAATPPPILALPQAQPTAPAPAFTVPQASVEPAPPAAEARAGAPAAAAAAGPARETSTTPASFNAAYLRNAPPRYPLIARRNGVEGTVKLKVLVTKEGKPAQVQLEQTSGSSVLDTAAIEAVRGWQFVPARRGPDAIESWVVVPVVFKLENLS